MLNIGKIDKLCLFFINCYIIYYWVEYTHNKKEKQKIILKSWINYYEQKKRYKSAKCLADQYYTKKIYVLTFNNWKNKYYNSNWVKVCFKYIILLYKI